MSDRVTKSPIASPSRVKRNNEYCTPKMVHDYVCSAKRQEDESMTTYQDIHQDLKFKKKTLNHSNFSESMEEINNDTSIMPVYISPDKSKPTFRQKPLFL